MYCMLRVIGCHAYTACSYRYLKNILNGFPFFFLFFPHKLPDHVLSLVWFLAVRKTSSSSVSSHFTEDCVTHRGCCSLFTTHKPSCVFISNRWSVVEYYPPPTHPFHQMHVAANLKGGQRIRSTITGHIIIIYNGKGSCVSLVAGRYHARQNTSPTK